MQKFVLAAFASVAAAETIPTMIESKMKELVDHVPNGCTGSTSVVISQVSGQDKFVLLANDTFADPNPVATGAVEHFNVGGMWNMPNVDLATVHFECFLQGISAYTQDYTCTDGDANCPIATMPGTEWKGVFDFDVPGFAPPFLYDVQVTAKDSAGAELFKLESKFCIP